MIRHTSEDRICVFHFVMSQESRSRGWKTKLNRSTENSFIGRTIQLQAFRVALSTPHEKRTTSIFSISGQGGIGKTTLLKQFRKITEELRHVAAYVDEGSQTNLVNDVPEALSRLALDLEKQGIELKKFQERYKVYRQKKQELEADPDAPQGSVAGIGKIIAKAGLGMAKSIPGSGGIMEFVDSDWVVNQGGEWATLVARKLTNKDEVQLVQKPVEVLTPLFLEDLNQVAEQQTIVLLLDTYEQTGAFLDDWLRSLLDDRYDKSLHPNCLICIAGRDPLNKNAWIEWKELIARSELEPFTEVEARLYLASCGITQELIVQEIWKLSSGGLPVLIAMMAQGAPCKIEQITDPCEDAVERFLKWEKDEKKRKIAQNAALPRVLNRDVLATLTSDEEADGLFEWLKSRSFVVQHPNGWQYHSLVREQILRYQRKLSLKSWVMLHEKLANYYDGLRQRLNLKASRQWKDETWQQYSLEWLYHTLCVSPQQSLGIALNAWLAALRRGNKIAQEWAATVWDAGKATNDKDLDFWGNKLHSLKNYEDDEKLIEVISLLIEGDLLEDEARAFALVYHVLLALNSLLKPKLTAGVDEFQFSLEDTESLNPMIETLNQALNLDSEAAEAFILRGIIHVLEGDLNTAEADFTRAVDLAAEDRAEALYSIQDNFFQVIEALRKESTNSEDRVRLIESIRRSKNKKQELKNENQELRNEIQQMSAELFRVHWRRKNYDEALAAFNQSIVDNPEDDCAWCALGEISLFHGETNQAIKALDRALQINSQYSRTYYAFALLHLTLNELDLFKIKLAMAIQIAQTRYDQFPNDWRNVLELALYHLINDQAAAADSLYRQAVNQRAPRDRINTAIWNLRNFLTLFPDFSQLQQRISLLEAAE